MKMIQPPSLSMASALIIIMAMLLVYVSIGHAGQDDVPNITMSVLESEDDAEQRVVSEILLPETASPVAHERSAKGHATANEAHKRGREFGQDRAEQARDRDKKKPDKPAKPAKPDRPDRPDRDDDDD